MRVIDDYKFNSCWPERYSWYKIDSIKHSELAISISSVITFDLQSDERLLTPGLRKVLIMIAERTEI